MLRSIPRIHQRRRRGRPFGPRPCFIDDFWRIEATEWLAKSRGACVGDQALAVPFTITGTEPGRPARIVFLPVATTSQPLGGVRYWWRCPRCHRRCGVLLVAPIDGPVGCRACFRARYISDYRTRHRDRRLLTVVRHVVVDGSVPLLDDRCQRDLDLVAAKRRRGVRRGRRVLTRLLRHLAAGSDMRDFLRRAGLHESRQ